MTDAEAKEMLEEIEYIAADCELLKDQVLKDNVAAAEIAHRAAKNVEHIQSLQLRLHRLSLRVQVALVKGQ